MWRLAAWSKVKTGQGCQWCQSLLQSFTSLCRRRKKDGGTCTRAQEAARSWGNGCQIQPREWMASTPGRSADALRVCSESLQHRKACETTHSFVHNQHVMCRSLAVCLWQYCTSPEWAHLKIGQLYSWLPGLYALLMRPRWIVLS